MDAPEGSLPNSGSINTKARTVFAFIAEERELAHLGIQESASNDALTVLNAQLRLFVASLTSWSVNPVRTLDPDVNCAHTLVHLQPLGLTGLSDCGLSHSHYILKSSDSA